MDFDEFGSNGQTIANFFSKNRHIHYRHQSRVFCQVFCQNNPRNSLFNISFPIIQKQTDVIIPNNNLGCTCITTNSYNLFDHV